MNCEGCVSYHDKHCGFLENPKENCLYYYKVIPKRIKVKIVPGKDISFYLDGVKMKSWDLFTEQRPIELAHKYEKELRKEKK